MSEETTFLSSPSYISSYKDNIYLESGRKFIRKDANNGKEASYTKSCATKRDLEDPLLFDVKSADARRRFLVDDELRDQESRKSLPYN